MIRDCLNYIRLRRLIIALQNVDGTFAEFQKAVNGFSMVFDSEKAYNDLTSSSPPNNVIENAE